MADDEYTERDAAELLAIGLFRYHYRDRGVYSNGTEHEWQLESAENVFAVTPMLRKALEYAVRHDPDVGRYAEALMLANHETIAEYDGTEEAA